MKKYLFIILAVQLVLFSFSSVVFANTDDVSKEVIKKITSEYNIDLNEWIQFDIADIPEVVKGNFPGINKNIGQRVVRKYYAGGIQEKYHKDGDYKPLFLVHKDLGKAVIGFLHSNDKTSLVEIELSEDEVAPATYADSGDDSLLILKMPVPKAYSELDFSQNTDFKTTVNGSSYFFRGEPFVSSDNLTFIPVRDFSEVFGIKVEYHNDQSIKLMGDNLTVIISPTKSLYDKGVVVYKNGEYTFYNGYDYPEYLYVLVNDLSYLPLRFILETFGMNVEYDNMNKSITIRGNRITNKQNENLFSADQKRLIEAAVAYEVLSQIKVSGNHQAMVTEPVHFDAEITRSGTSETIKAQESTGDQYIASRTCESNKEVIKILPNGTLEYVNLFYLAGQHPYFYLGILELDGINKYKKMDIKKVSESEDLVEYFIKIIDKYDSGFEIKLNKNTNKIMYYKQIGRYYWYQPKELQSFTY